jgi:hypothetical protein
MIMGSMSLETSYEVLEMLRDDGVQTFRAKERATGRLLELHLFLPFGRPENKVLFEKLKSLPLEVRRKFLDIGVDGSTPFLVTDPLAGGRGFKSWADELIAGMQAPPSVFGATLAPPSRDDGVQILQAGQWKTGTPIPDSLVSKPPARPPQPPPETGGDFTAIFQAGPIPTAAPQEKHGEFTGLFQAMEPEKVTKELQPPIGEFTGLFRPAGPSTTGSFASTPPPPAGPVAPQPPGGEFTRMFQNPLETVPQAPPQASAPARQPDRPPGGEFTKYFENPLKPPPMGTPRPMIEPPPPPQPPPQGGHRGGEFTNVFGNPSGPLSGSLPGSQQAPAPPPQAGAFGAMPSATGAFAPQPAWSQPQAQPSFQSGPSEYTKMMGAPAMPTLGQAPPAGQMPMPPAPAKPNMMLYVALGVVIVLLIGIAIFLAMHMGGTAPATSPAAK